MAALFEYVCSNCGIVIFNTEEEIKKEKCSCGESKETKYVYLGVNPVEYNNLSDIEKQQLVQRALNLNDQQYKEQKEVWKRVREPIEKKYEEERQERARRDHEIEMRNRVRCPYCNSVNVSKISTLGRAASVGAFGLASKKIGKQWHCNSCKSDF